MFHTPPTVSESALRFTEFRYQSTTSAAQAPEYWQKMFPGEDYVTSAEVQFLVLSSLQDSVPSSGLAIVSGSLTAQERFALVSDAIRRYCKIWDYVTNCDGMDWELACKELADLSVEELGIEFSDPNEDWNPETWKINLTESEFPFVICWELGE